MRQRIALALFVVVLGIAPGAVAQDEVRAQILVAVGPVEATAPDGSTHLAVGPGTVLPAGTRLAVGADGFVRVLVLPSLDVRILVDGTTWTVGPGNGAATQEVGPGASALLRPLVGAGRSGTGKAPDVFLLAPRGVWSGEVEFLWYAERDPRAWQLTVAKKDGNDVAWRKELRGNLRAFEEEGLLSRLDPTITYRVEIEATDEPSRTDQATFEFYDLSVDLRAPHLPELLAEASRLLAGPAGEETQVGSSHHLFRGRAFAAHDMWSNAAVSFLAACRLSPGDARCREELAVAMRRLPPKEVEGVEKIVDALVSRTSE